MADEIARRREIRRRKILESSEARLKKITSSNIKKNIENDSLSHGDFDTKSTNINKDHEDRNKENSEVYDDGFLADDYYIASGEQHSYENQSSSCRNRLKADEPPYSYSANGNFTRSCSPDNYTFPKKVSDAETRSFGRTRSDVRRNSSCTQIMMETLQFSSFSLTVLRFWLTIIAAFTVKTYFLLIRNIPIFRTILIPFVMLEIAFYTWSKFEAQMCSRPVASSIITGVLLLCKIPPKVISTFNHVWNTIQSSIIRKGIKQQFIVEIILALKNSVVGRITILCYCEAINHLNSLKRMADPEELVCKSDSSCQFDIIIGYIEDIIIDPSFAKLQHSFMEQHYQKFEECEENKLEYMDVFNLYNDLRETHRNIVT
ncbi:uncharacterized protein CEXT_549091 [Caerostris extrusa]|uniref:ADP-ribosylation factor-like protein 2-binding protein n=1 Tax=Caerostris extrusa TaxID=172846 RepID=A0AAV4T122_CAEEX|nr:uncharacterized protein CEXT_549091 [Caerostris extrusa]